MDSVGSAPDEIRVTFISLRITDVLEISYPKDPDFLQFHVMQIFEIEKGIYVGRTTGDKTQCNLSLRQAAAVICRNTTATQRRQHSAVSCRPIAEIKNGVQRNYESHLPTHNLHTH